MQSDTVLKVEKVIGGLTINENRAVGIRHDILPSRPNDLREYQRKITISRHNFNTYAVVSAENQSPSAVGKRHT
jgi:hypothetical protein